MKIYTKTGDKGKTSLFGGTRVPKYHDRLESYGTIDELNSFIGLISDSIYDESTKDILLNIQYRLFSVGSDLANEKQKNVPTISDSDIETLEKLMDEYDKELEPMKYFILPGGHIVSSYCQVARTICRRAERLALKVSEDAEVNINSLKYLNRLSDYLFVLARKVLKDNDCKEIPWKPFNERGE